MIGRDFKLACLALNLALLVAFGTALGFGARAIVTESAREWDIQAQQIRQYASTGLEWSRGNVRQLRDWLAPLPLGSSFAGIEIRGKSGIMLDIRYDVPFAPPVWADALPPLGPSVLELALDAKNSLVLRLVPAPSYPASRLAEAMYPAVTGGAAAILAVNLFCWILSRRRGIARIEQAHWERAVSPPPAEEAPDVPVTPVSPTDWLERCPDAIVICDAERRVSYANAAAHALFRHTPAIEPGGAVIELIVPWDRARFAEALDARDDAGSATPIERFHALTAQGGVRPVDVAIKPLTARGTELILSLRDAGAAQALENSLELRGRLLDTITLGLALVSSRDHGEVLYSNEAFRSLLRFTASPRRVTLPGLLSAGSDDSTVREIEAAVEKTVPVRLSLPWRTGDGASATLEIRLVPLSPDPTGSSCLAVIVRDRTEEAAARDRIDRELALNRTILEDMPLGLCVATAEGKALAVNARLAELTGRPRSQLLDSEVEEWLPRDPKTKGRVLYGEFTIRTDGATKSIKVHTLAPRTGAGEYVYFLDDVSLYRQQMQSNADESERLQLILDSIGEGIIVTNKDGFIQYLNPHAKYLTGLEEQQYEGMPVGKVLHLMDERKHRPLADPVLRAMSIGKTVKFRQDVLLLSESKPELAVEISATPVFDHKQALIGCVVVLKDVSEQRLLARQMKMRASRDPLTGLVNRRELLSILETLQYEVDEYHKQHALCYMDLDKFKVVNDTCGHHAGDELLRQVSHMMSECLRAQDILARIGGDEFCAVLPSTSPQDAESVAERIRESVKSFRFSWDGKYFEIGISIGITELKPGLGVEQNLDIADQACYTAKEKGRDLVYISTGQEEEGKSVLSPWNERLFEAMEHDYFQFSFREARFLHGSASSVPAFCEILLQLCEPDQTPLAASAFMPNAHRLNLVPVIERWAICKLFSSIHLFAPAPSNDLRVYAISLSAVTLSESSFISFLIEQSERHRIPPSSICFVIAENDLVQNYSLVQDFMSRCKEQGYRFCLNQFGGGVSSFAYVRNLPLDFLKIDDGLTHRIEVDGIDKAIVSAIQNIAENMNILTIAQNVNSPSRLERLRTLGIHYAQGAAAEASVAESSAA